MSIFNRDVKTLSMAELKILNTEIRSFIIEEVSKIGGHLGASLGVVELTTALHYVFDSPSDTIIWDIGHQTYAHKILTGRKEKFHTIRSYNGLSGFTNPEESSHDHFFAGHSSTSISLGVGVSSAKLLQHNDTYTLAVIGDGAISAGMAFEAMNNVTTAGKKFITILNDNDMSISPPEGAISKYLPKLFMSHGYQEIKSISKKFLSKFPNKFFEFCSHTHKSIKGIVSGGNFFEELGYDYIGPINGHDTEALVRILEIVKENATKPVLVHIITKKGNGYKPAENAKDKFHGVKPFNISTGSQTKSLSVSFSQFIAQEITRLAKDDNTITAVTPAMKQGSALDCFANMYPSRFFDVGIAEQHAVTFSAGQAKQGLKTFCFLYSTFMQRAYDQIIHDVALQNLPVCFIIDRSGLTGEDGPTHHGIFDVAFLRIIPNVEICNVCDESSAIVALKYAQTCKSPIFIRITKGDITNINITYVPYKLSIIQNGNTGLLITTGRFIHKVIESDTYKNWMIIDPFFIKPLDENIFEYIQQYDKIDILDENSIGGLSSIILEGCHSRNISTTKIKIQTIPDKFIPHGSNKDLFTKECGF
ncbi:MAG: 1-deoxy-D-xylulose-5-phosphate synthase [Candidatus Deianiraeaceae bacterium]|jgi:1-deoxy-D-xylulose-5-phosphate synthase